MKKEYYRGIRGIQFIWHGSQSDPELSYLGKVVNYWDVEDTMWYRYKEEMGTEPNPDDEPTFTRYCYQHADEIKQLITDIWNQSRS